MFARKIAEARLGSALATLAFAMLGIVTFMPSASADDIPLQGFKAANQSLQRDLLKGKAESLKNPVYAKLISSAFNTKVLSAAKTQSVMAVGTLCETVSRTLLGYVQFGIPKKAMQGAKATDELILAQNANYVRFQDEITVAQRFALPCQALMAQKLEILVALLKPTDLTPTRRGGLKRVQHGLVETISGAARSIFDPVRPENRMALLDLTVTNIEPLTAAMSKDSRQSAAIIVKDSLSQRGLPHSTREKLDKILHALNRKDCGTLCSL